MMHDLDRLRQAFLTDRDVDCPGCGYNLRDLCEPRCPECREPIDLQVCLVETYLSSMVIAIVGFTMGTGAAGLFLIGMIVLSILYANSAPTGIYVIPGIWLVVEGVTLRALASRRGRRWFRLTSRRRRILTIVVGWFMSLALLITMILYFTLLI